MYAAFVVKYPVQGIFQDYFMNNQLLIGVLLCCWMLGFNAISYTIYTQFEQHEERPVDDYELLLLDNNNDSGNQQMIECQNPQTVIVALPSMELAVGISKN